PDGLATYRHAKGLPATAIAWGPWAEATGVARHLADDGGRTWRIPMPTAAALSLLDRALVSPHPCLVAAHLAGGAHPAKPSAPVRPRFDLRRELGDQSPEERQGTVLVIVRQAIAQVLGYAGHESVSAHQPFQELGISSLMA